MTHVVVVGDLAVDVLVEPATTAPCGGDAPARIRTVGGGTGANTAAWLAHLGAEVTLVARIGDDPAGQGAVTGLRAAGVRTAVAVDPDAPTATVVVMLETADDGSPERTMYGDRGAAGRLAPSDLPPLDGVDHLHVAGYVLPDEGSRDAGIAALAAARRAGVSTSVDPQPAAGVGAAFLAWVHGSDLLLPNRDELSALTGSADPACAAALLGRVGAVAVSAGAAGASWIDARGVRSVPAPRVSVVDPTGAGDAFDAGVLVAWLAGAGPEEVLRAGCAAGAVAVGRAGARPPAPRR